jgi:hypothetical protein
MVSLKKISIVFFMLFVTSILSAEIHGKMPGGEPFASWEDGAQDFFVMFNSNIDNLMEILGEDPENPQGDSCIDQSFFTLNPKHIPEDAIIEKAYLVWMGAVDPSKLDDPTDNTVKLSFIQMADDSVTWEEEISVGEPGSGKTINDENSFEFESIRFTDDVIQGCSASSGGNIVKDQELGYFTYRKDITDFFDSIYNKNKEIKEEQDDVDIEKSIYYGTYTFSDLECTQHDNYRCITTMVSAWAVFFIYRSQGISSKKIYFYDGLSFVQGAVSTAEVGGFELPKNPAVRLTTMVAEGDPGLYEPFLPPEGVFLKGEGATSKFRLWNACNPIVGNYVEVFNSVSSLIHWDSSIEDNITCVSYEDEWMNYGIEVDTFLLDSEKNINLQEHLKKGNTSMEIELSVNQDAILTNFMVLSVDNKGSNFDIPPEASDPSKSKLNFPYDREKHFCGCPASDSTARDYWCMDSGSQHREFYYFVKVQNWGDEDTGSVRVWDELDYQLNYIPGSTEFATNYDAASDTYDDWEQIPDKSGGAFPLSGEGVVISPKMTNCNQSTWSCKDTVLIRYKVRPKQGTPKNYVFNNLANIKDSNDDSTYKTNRSYPLKLSPTLCVRDTDCPSPTPEMCGGTNTPKECGEAGLPDCGDGMVCEDFICVDDPSVTCYNSTGEFKLGKNTPLDMIIPKDNNDVPLIAGQFTVQVNNCEENKFFNLDLVSIEINRNNDTKFQFSDLELFHDVNGNGVVDDGDRKIASADLDGTTAKFFPGIIDGERISGFKKYSGSTLNYFIVRTKVDYSSEEITRGTKFNFTIESSSAIEISDQGTAFMSGTNIDFAEFTLEPTGEFFIVTRGAKDPAVPGYKEINSDIPVLQMKTKSATRANEITRINVRVAPGSYVKFGEKNGITGLSLFVDSNGDGQGNFEIARIDKFDGISSSVFFTDFTQKLTYAPGEIKHLVIKAKFNMKDVEEGEKPMAAKINIPNGGITLSDTAPTIYELPLLSKEFVYQCAPGDPDCKTDPPPPPSCDCTVVSVENGAAGRFMLLLLALFMVALIGKNTFLKRSEK